MKRGFLALSPQKTLRPAWLLFALLICAHVSFSQKPDSAKHVLHFKSTIAATNNGFSFIPTFTLGKPAVIVFLNVSGKRRLSFEPEFRYSMLDYKPWSFVFIWRYKLLRRERFQLSLGTHVPALNFKTESVALNGTAQNIIQARRFYPAVEVMPLYRFGQNFTLGAHLQFGKGIDQAVSSDIYFAALRPNFNHIPLWKRAYLRFNPQFYYLKIAENDGVYAAGSLALALRDFPFSFSVMANKALRSSVAAKDFDWSLNLNYSFGRNFVER